MLSIFHTTTQRGLLKKRTKIITFLCYATRIRYEFFIFRFYRISVKERNETLKYSSVSDIKKYRYKKSHYIDEIHIQIYTICGS